MYVSVYYSLGFIYMYKIGVLTFIMLPQTPAERVKAKLKLMLEKTSDKLNKEHKSEEQVMSYALPSAADIAKIEGDSFEVASFVSHRTAKKQVWRERLACIV